MYPCNELEKKLRTIPNTKDIKFLPGGHSVVEPPDPIPNSEVKRNSADDSGGPPPVKVGHRQAPNLKTLHQFIERGFFIVFILHFIKSLYLTMLIQALCEKQIGFILKNDWKILVFDRIDSTSSYLKNNPQEKKTIVVAESQSKGYGRLGSHWSSPQVGNIYLSMFLPAFELAGTSPPLLQLPLAIAFACVDVLKKQGICAQVKWPNDVLIGEQKLAGVLCEAVYLGAKLQGIVVGLGLNVFMSSNDAIDQPWTSLACVDERKSWNRNLLVASLANGIYWSLRHGYVEHKQMPNIFVGREIVCRDAFLRKKVMIKRVDFSRQVLMMDAQGVREFVATWGEECHVK